MPKYANNTKILQNFLKLIIILCLVMCISVFFLSFSPTANAHYTYNLNGITSNSTLQYDNNGVYITSFNGSNLEINYIINNTIDKRTLKISGDIKNVTTDNGTIYAISYSNNTVFLNRYVYNTDTLNSFIISDAKINSDYKFAVSGNRLYFAENGNNTITCYNIYGEKLYSFYIDSIIDYRTDSNNTLYIFTQNQIYTLDTTDNYQPVCILNTVNMRANIFFCCNTFFDYSGYIINQQNGTVISTKIEGDKINCAVINEYYCKYYSNNICGYNQHGDKYSLYNINAGENAQLCNFQDKLYLLSATRELFIIEQSELNFPQIEDNSSNNSTVNNSNQNNNTSSTTQNTNPQTNNNSYNNGKKDFSINNYYIDAEKNIIWDIPSGTTIANFKNNLTYDGYELQFYNKDNVKKTSGKIGTGFVMVIENGGIEHSRYSISVKGDLSGEGSVNKSDVKILSQYLMNNYALTEEQYAASDCNGDNILDGVDILKIAKNNL